MKFFRTHNGQIMVQANPSKKLIECLQKSIWAEFTCELLPSPLSFVHSYVTKSSNNKGIHLDIVILISNIIEDLDKMKNKLRNVKNHYEKHDPTVDIFASEYMVTNGLGAKNQNDFRFVLHTISNHEKNYCGIVLSTGTYCNYDCFYDGCLLPSPFTAKSSDQLIELCSTFLQEADYLLKQLATEFKINLNANYVIDLYPNTESIKRNDERNTKQIIESKIYDSQASKWTVNTNEITTHSTDKKFHDLVGLQTAKTEMQKWITLERNSDTCKSFGITEIRNGIILYGPPGTGKTSLIKALAGETGYPLISVQCSDLINAYQGSGATNVAHIMSYARQLAKKSPVLLFFDEINAFVRMTGFEHTEQLATIATLQTELDGVKNNHNIILCGTTNFLNQVPEAFQRRFPLKVHIPLPTKEERESLFLFFIRRIMAKSNRKTFADNINLVVLANSSTGFSPAEIELAIDQANKTALYKFIEDPTSFTEIDTANILAEFDLVKQSSKGKTIGF